MAISASVIAQVLPRILTGTGSDLVFNGLVLTKNASLVTGAATSFASADSVGAFFGIGSDEYKFASVYFGGYQNSQIKPSRLYFYKQCDDAAAPFVRGASVTPATALAALKALSSGTFTISLSGTSVTVSALDLSGASSLSGAADLLQAALRSAGGESNAAAASATVAFDSQKNAFTVTSGATGEEAGITAATGTIAEAMNLTEEAGAVLSAGSGAKTPAESIAACTGVFQNFVTFTTIWEPEDDEALALAQWASSSVSAGTMYLYVVWDSDARELNAEFHETIADKLAAANVGATCIVYPSYLEAAFVMGTAASIDWEARNGSLTFAFKAQDGLGATIVKTDDHNTLLDRKVNFIGNYATRNDNFIFFYNGSMLGSWAWIDAYLGATWLCNALQVQIMAGFQSVRRVPYTEAGYAIIRSWCRDVISRGLTNGVIDTGMTLSETQKTALTQDLGGDYSEEIERNGYYLQVVDATAAVRQARTSPSCNLVYTYAGAVQKLTLPATAVV